MLMLEYLTVEEVAQKLRKSTYTVIRLIKSGQLVAYKVSGTWRITPADLHRYLDAQRSTKSPDQES